MRRRARDLAPGQASQPCAAYNRIMFTVRRIRAFALVALFAFGFAQAAVAAMGCASMRVESGRAVMPSGEPCDMLPDSPGALGIKHCGLGDGQTTVHAPAPSGDATALPLFAIEPVAARKLTGAFAHARKTLHILGPPPFQTTQRLRL